MASRPWVTPQEVIDYTDYPSVQARAPKKLEVDISRAEDYVISYTHNDFKDDEKYPEIPSSVKTAVILIAEMYAFNASQAAEGKGAYQSETFDDYSYTIADMPTRLDNIILGPLLDEYAIAKSKNQVTLRLSKL